MPKSDPASDSAGISRRSSGDFMRFLVMSSLTTFPSLAAQRLDRERCSLSRMVPE